MSMVSTEEQTSYERLKLFINLQFDGNLTKFANAIDIAPTIIDIYRRRGTVLPYKHRGRIEKLGLNWQWYEFGNGEMLISKEPQIIESNVSGVEEVYIVTLKNLSKMSFQQLENLKKEIIKMGEELVS